MPYAIVQNTLDPPSIEQLTQAFRALPSLTDTDAATMARDAFGVLVQGLELADAGRLLQALRAAGVACDHLGRAKSFGWSQIVMLAAGAVELSEWRHSTEERVVGHIGGGPGPGPGYEATPITRTIHKDTVADWRLAIGHCRLWLLARARRPNADWQSAIANRQSPIPLVWRSDSA